MPTVYDYNKFQRYLFELESALSLIGIRDCQDLQDHAQLRAVIYALSERPRSSAPPFRRWRLA